MSRKLFCHTDLKPFFTANKTYEIIFENNICFHILADNGESHILTKENDFTYQSYETWMNIAYE